MRLPLRSSGPSKTGGVGWETRKWTVLRPIRTGRSKWDFEDSRTTSSSSGEYQSAGSGVAGSSGSSAPGMSFHRKCWKVRTRAVSMGYFE